MAGETWRTEEHAGKHTLQAAWLLLLLQRRPRRPIQPSNGHQQRLEWGLTTRAKALSGG